MKADSQALTRTHISIFLLSIIILIIALWSPVGLRNTPNSGEEWHMVEVVEHEDSLLTDEDWTTRPLRWIPYLVAFHLAPDSLMGFNIVLIALFALRGIATYLIFSQLFPAKPMLAYMTALFYLIYPIGTGYYDNNTINLQVSIIFGLFSIFALLLYWQTNKKWLWGIILTTQLLSLLTYELFYLVYAIAPILLWWLDKRIMISRRFVSTIALLYAPCVILGMRTLWILSNKPAHHINDTFATTATSETPLTLLVYTTPRLYYNHGVAWINNLRELNNHSGLLAYIVLASLAIGLLTWWLYRFSKMETARLDTFSSRQYLLIVSYNLLFMSATFLPYMSILKFFNSDWRTYFLPSIGAAFMVALLIDWLHAVLPLKKLTYSLSLIILLVIGISHQANQLQQDADDSVMQKQLFANLLQTVPATDATIVLIQVDNRYYPTRWFWVNSFDVGLTYISEKRMNAFICTPVPTAPVNCNFTPDKFEINFNVWGSQRVFDYAEVIIFYINNDGSLALLEDIHHYTDYVVPSYHPYDLIQDTSYSDRVYTYFDCFPLDQCDLDIANEFIPQSAVEVDFTEPVDGIGFPIHFLNKEQGRQWMQGSHGVLTYLLEPDHTYLLEISVNMLDENLYDRLEINVNNQPIQFIKQGSGVSRKITALIPADWIDETLTTIEFNIPQNTKTQSADRNLLFDWLTLKSDIPSEWQPQSAIRIDFDKAVIGEYWSNPSPNGSMWTVGNYSTLYLPLIPNQVYSFEFAVTAPKSEILDGLTLEIKGVELPLVHEMSNGITLFSGTIPSELVSDFNLLEIRTKETFIPAEIGMGADTRELGLFFDWLEIQPIAE